ncbi:MAG: diguanylate cyclase domain-containing protein, partial [Gammaproteobacteria bacterium]
LYHNDAELPPITVSIGVASLEHAGADDLLRRADLALYASKDAGRNRVTCWAAEMEAPASAGAEPVSSGPLELHRLPD